MLPTNAHDTFTKMEKHIEGLIERQVYNKETPKPDAF
jgi:hypothetical protein